MRLSGWKLPVEHLSPSAISDFLTCPEKFRQERILKLRKKLHVDAFIGTVHHATVQENFVQKIDTGRDQTLEQQLGIYKVKWEDEIEEEGEPEWFDHPERVADLGEKMIGSFHETAAPVITPTAVEQRFEERISGVPVPIVGYIDVEERERIDELKTAKQKVSTPKPAWRVQALIYQLFSRKPVYWSVTTKQKTPVTWNFGNAPGLMIPVASPDVTVELIVQVGEALNDCYSRYGTHNPWPMTGLIHTFACDYCSAGPKNPNPTCPAWRKT